MSLDLATVRKIARLSSLHLEENDLEPLVQELNSILGFVEQLDAIDTTDVPAMTSAVDVTMPEREDAVTDGNYPERVLDNAPYSAEGFYAVPKVVE